MKTLLLLLIFCACNSGHKYTKGTTDPAKTFEETATIWPETNSYNPLPPFILIQLPADVNPESFGLDDLSVRGTSGCPSNPVLSFSLTGHEVRVLLNTVGCAHEDLIKVSLNMAGLYNMKGDLGTGLVEATFELNTNSAPAPLIDLVTRAVNQFPNQFSLVFDSSINMNSITASSFVLEGHGSCPASPFTGLMKVGSVVTVTYDSSGCVDGDSISFKILNSTIKDVNGRSGLGIISRELTLDTIGLSPSDVVVDLVPGFYNPLPTSLSLTFPEGTDMDSVTLSDFMISGDGTCPASTLSSLSKTNNVATLTLNVASCTNLNVVSFDFDLQGVKDLAGNDGSGLISTRLQLLDTAPVSPLISLPTGILRTLPTSLSLDFGVGIDPSTVTEEAITITRTGGCTLNPLTNISMSSHTATLTVDPTGCGNGDSLTLHVDMSLVKNLAGLSGTGIISRTFTLDSLGPETPIFSFDSGVFAALPTSLQITFGSDTDMQTVNSASILIGGSGSCPLSAGSISSISGTTVTVGLDGLGCVNLDTLTVAIDLSLIKDLVGNPGTSVVSKVLTLDSSSVAIPSLSVPQGPSQALPTAMNITFGPTTDMNTVDLSDFTFQGTGSCLANPLQGLNIVGYVAHLNLLTSGCQSGDSLMVSLDMGSIETLSQQAGSGVVRYTMTLDNQGPTAPTIDLAGGSVGILPTTLHYTFPSDTLKSSVSLADFDLIGSSCSSAGLSSISKVGHEATLTINPAGCVSGQSLVLNLNMSTVTDSLGNFGSGTASASFILDQDGPALPQITPASATVSSLPSTVTVVFSGDTSMASVVSSDLSFTGANACVGTVSNFSLSGHLATVSLNYSGCVSGETMQLSISGSSILDEFGNSGSGSVSQTYTLDNHGPALALMTTPSSIVAVMPTSVSVTFSSDTDMASVAAGDFTLTPSGSCVSSISSISKTAQVATLTLNSQSCAHGNTLVVSLNMAGVSDSHGNHGHGLVSSTFTLDSVGPAAATIGTASATLASLPNSVAVTFSSDTDMASVTAADFTAVGTGACPVNALSGVSISGQVATVSFNKTGCAHGNTISLSVLMNGVRDGVANPGTGAVSASYTLDSVGPTTLIPSPAGGIVALFPTMATLTFGADVDMSTVDSSDLSVQVSGLCGAAAVTGFSKSGQVATVTISSACVLGGITFNTNMAGIKDTLGNSCTGVFSVTWLRVL